MMRQRFTRVFAVACLVVGASSLALGQGDGPHVTQWLNKVKYAEYVIGSDDWIQRVAASKFGKMDGFGKNTRGHISLQGDHGNVCFASIKIRPLPTK